ncbi:hypothetical protein D3C73_725440 [compost metagenome]
MKAIEVGIYPIRYGGVVSRKHGNRACIIDRIATCRNLGLQLVIPLCVQFRQSQLMNRVPTVVLCGDFKAFGHDRLIVSILGDNLNGISLVRPAVIQRKHREYNVFPFDILLCLCTPNRR